MDIPFPLLRLPNVALLNVLKSMKHNQLAALSFLSEKSRNLVISLKLKANAIFVFITESLEIMVKFPRGEDLVYIFDRDIWIGLRNVEYIIDLLKTIFHRKLVSLEFKTDAHWYDLDSVHATIGHFHLLRLASGDYEFNRKIVNFFKPDAVILFQDAFQNGGIPKRILIQNISKLHSEFTTTRLTLDDLLIMNSMDVYLNQVTLTEKEINRFIKLWIKGSNSKLGVLQLMLISRNHNAAEEMWKGIKYRDIPLHIKRPFKCPDISFTMEGGRDIHRMDGTKATCFFSPLQGFVTFSMFVWQEHFNVN